MNRFLVAGEVVAIDDERLTVESVERTPNGEYPCELDIYFTDTTPSVSVGSRIKALGKRGKNE